MSSVYNSFFDLDPYNKYKSYEGVCEVCNTKFDYSEEKCEEPGFRSHCIDIIPCKCGKHYGWVKEDKDYRYIEEGNFYRKGC